MLRFVLADDAARLLASERPPAAKRLWAGAVKTLADAPRAVWDEITVDRSHPRVRPRLTAGDARWTAAASMSHAHAELAAAADGALAGDSVSAAAALGSLRVTGNVRLFDDHLDFETHNGSPVAPFTLRTDEPVHVVGVVDGNDGPDSLVISLATGQRVVVRLGRWNRGLAEVIGGLGPA